MDKFVIRSQKETIETERRSTSSPISSLSEPVAGTSENVLSDCSDSDETDSGDEIPAKKRKYKKYKIDVNKYSQKFTWLDTRKTIYFCKLCNQKITGSSFHLKRHSMSSMHLKFEKIAKKTLKIDKIFKEPNQTKIHSLVKEAELRMCCYLCEHSLPMLLLDTLPTFNRCIYPDSEVARGVTLKRDKGTKLIVGVLAPYFKAETISDLKKHYFSIIIDETTDIGTKKSMVVVVRYMKNGRVTDKLLDLIEVETSTGECLFLTIKGILDSNDIPYANIIGFGADNANTMMGVWQGVQSRLKKIAPNIYIQGCSCHSLHLCASAAAKKLPKSVEQFARDVYAYFSHSSKRAAELRECQIFVNEKPHKMLYPSQTRWLSLKAVVQRLLEHWNSLTLFFQREALEDNLPSAKSILNALNNVEYKIYLMFLSYMLELIVKVNVELQSEIPKAPVLLNRLSTLYKTVLRCFIKKDIIDKSGLQAININNPHNYTAIEDMYVGAKLDAYLKSENCTVSQTALKNFRLRALDFFIELGNQIKQRFRFDDPHLKYAANFDPHVALSGDIRSIAEFINLFPNVPIDIESANTEWQLLPELNIPGLDKTGKVPDLDVFWEKVFSMKNSLGEPMFNNLVKIVGVILSLPHSSATAERMFSQLNLTKTFLRNRMLVKTAAAILLVKDKMRTLPNGAQEWRPDEKILNYNSSVLEQVVVLQTTDDQ